MSHGPTGSRRIVRWVLLGGATLLLLLVIDAAWSAWAISREVRAARVALERAAEDLESGRVTAARASFEDARRSAAGASAAASHPVGLIAAALPLIGDDVAAVRALSEATELAAEAGARIADAADAAGWDGGSIPGASPGRVDPGVIEAARAPLEEAEVLLLEAAALIEPLDDGGKLGPIGEAIRTADEEVALRAKQVARAAALAGLLPGFLGADGPRTYAIVMMTLSDPRGSGGYPGSYGVMRVQDGRFELEELAPTSDLGRVRAVDAPRDAIRRYARFGGLTHFISSTYSPDWPTSAQIWMRMWEASGREPLDGVIGADSVWMSYLLEAIGPVDTPAWPETIAADNVSRILDADTMLSDDKAESDAWQAAIATALWQTTVTRSLDPSAFADALSRGTAERHLQLYLADAEGEAALDELGASGRLAMPANPLMISWSGFVASRTGYFAEKSVTYEATVNEDGTTDVTISITLTNTAPAGPESILIGFATDTYPLGTYVAAANVYLPADARRIRNHIDGGRSLVDLFEREFERRVVLTVLLAEPGRTTTAEVSYRIATPRGAFELGIVPQPELHPSSVAVEVTFGDDRSIEAISPDTTLDGSVWRYEGTPRTPVQLRAGSSG